MALSRKKLLENLRRLHQERRRLIRRLTADKELAIGTVSVVRRKCGKPTCHCAHGPGHPQTLFLFKDEEGRRRCKLIRRMDEAWWHQAGKNYREFRDDLKQLRAINRREWEILMALKERRAVYYE